jgi:hypothetical protein
MVRVFEKDTISTESVKMAGGSHIGDGGVECVARGQRQTFANTWRRAPHLSEAVGGVGGVRV